MLLGIISSFLGIGGGPINLVVLGYCFSMDSKTAAVISLYIILFSQLASLLAALISGVPDFPPMALALMVAGGIGGGIAGRCSEQKDGQPGSGQALHYPDGTDYRHLYFQCNEGIWLI